MAWYNFYMQPAGDNTNSGTTTSNTASVTTTNGAWDTSTNRFTAASGTPFSGVAVGDFAAIMLDGATGFTSLNQITAVDPGGTYIDVTATGRVGIAPVTGASGRTCKIGGAWADFTIATAGSMFGASSTNAVPLLINVKAATYANASAAKTFAHAGNVSAPIWIRGYNATPGDLENDYTTAPPVLTFAAAGFTISGTCYRVSNLSVMNTGSSSAVWNWSGTNGIADRIRSEAQNTQAGASAFTCGGNGATMHVLNSYFKCWSGATQVLTATSAVQFHGCVFDGGQNAVTTSGASIIMNSCVCINQSTRAINASTAVLYLFGNSFVGPFSDSIVRWGTTPGAMGYVVNNVFSGAAKYDIEPVSGFTQLLTISNNASYGATLGHLPSGDLVDTHYIQESADPFTNGATDPTLKKTALAYLAGLGSRFENVAWRSYRSPGAVEPQPPAGGSSGGYIIGA
ncbi:unnamed protein product [Gemmata massiliana]|uniref:Right handed beta helix domain-containing protein n=1 Tax=Gemmata massiliana TaxID=1210884 RepID=A0A6P2DN96_9BACT|nr:hypothetical protein [Gemmata massiliana]VTS03507.1 unnamed protein product [Gemmata massiliana]